MQSSVLKFEFSRQHSKQQSIKKVKPYEFVISKAEEKFVSQEQISQLIRYYIMCKYWLELIIYDFTYSMGKFYTEV